MNKDSKDMFDIYQVKHGAAFRDFGFENLERLKSRDLKVEYSNYDFIYSGKLQEGMNLEDIYTKFNIDRPDDFKGHSLSVSDVVVLVKDGETTAHFVDSFGFKEVPEFVNEREAARKSRSSVLSALKENKPSSEKTKTDKTKEKRNSIEER
ncbi:protein of unknown function [Petrocella atlantisensis]|uniref:YodL-like domain-containing protein n=1 Tax=Petrocella atlantisensis TaxID=2173034 RepID=A0A3P7S3P0_9FIRM|nr:YodL domain-containing protein [Petrocella atlantisensis]VDN49232.1 protein of unknown function [Petrocella atlantisensis]